MGKETKIILQIKVMKLKIVVDNSYWGRANETIWSGDDMKECSHYEDIAIKHWGRDAVAIYPAE